MIAQEYVVKRLSRSRGRERGAEALLQGREEKGEYSGGRLWKGRAHNGLPRRFFNERRLILFVDHVFTLAARLQSIELVSFIDIPGLHEDNIDD